MKINAKLKDAKLAPLRKSKSLAKLINSLQLQHLQDIYTSTNTQIIIWLYW